MTPADDASALDTEESRVEVYVTTDTSAAPHKADEAKLYVMYDAGHTAGGKKPISPQPSGMPSCSGSRTASSTSTSQATCLNAGGQPALTPAGQPAVTNWPMPTPS